MPDLVVDQDAIVIGGGFYGAAIAVYLSRQRGLKRILLVEREAALMTRASYNNQARVHNGYHYPRSFTTAYRSRINLPRFVRDWPDIVKQDFTKIYAIARSRSKVTSRQFQHFCRDMGAWIQPAGPTLRKLFEPRLIEDVFLVEEFAFDSTKLAHWARAALSECNVSVCYQTHVSAIHKGDAAQLRVVMKGASQSAQSITCRYLFNCTYSGLNQIDGDFPGIGAQIRHEITEMPLLRMPPELKGLGITVMDGPFFSMMPFPARDLHTLSHVRYTPHLDWQDQSGMDPYEKLRRYHRDPRVDHMLRDVGRYIPAVHKAQYIESLFEIKTVLTMTEGNDARPIFFEKHSELPGSFSVLGGKIDNIYDVLEKLDEEQFPL